jgi:hypothetical protein
MLDQVNNEIMCDNCCTKARRAKATPPPSLQADLAALRVRAEKQFKDDKNPDAKSTWRQAKTLLETLEMLLKEGT